MSQLSNGNFVQCEGDEIISVGIDIGTTTTHLIITKLSFANSQLVNAAPSLAINKREILHESEIYFTPLNKDGEIDAEKTAEIIKKAYLEAGIEPGEVQTGALIITGQSARARNAEAVISNLAALAGDFVIESAGPHLESVLAARGSSAVEYSKQSGQTILNIDIGGGTSNFALIVAGKIVDTACLNIGARMVRFNCDRTIKSISAEANLLCQADKEKFKTIAVGSAASHAIVELATQMAELILHSAAGKIFAPPLNQLMLSEKLNSNYSLGAIDQLFLSGGVAASFSEEDLARYGDMGVYLAHALKNLLVQRKISFQISPRAMRATVIGAGLHTLQLSGSTIGFDSTLLPLRNLKIIKIDWQKRLENNQEQLLLTDLEKVILGQLKILEHDWSEAPIAMALSGITKDMLSFQFLKSLAQALSRCFLLYRGREPLIVVSDADLAMALALLLQGMLVDKRIITVDGINAEEGDYIDIGRPIYSSADPNTQSLPIVVKTLVFYESIV